MTVLENLMVRSSTSRCTLEDAERTTQAMAS